MTTEEPGGSAGRARRSANPTVHDVALEAGVSPMTVSRVLSGGKNVRAELQEKVWRAVEVLDYHRNENARSLRPGHRSGLIGVTITNIANPYYAEMLRGVEEIASQHGRRILVGNSNEDADLERQLVADFIGRRVEGLLMVPAGAGEAPHLQAERLNGVPVVLASRAVTGVQADTVLIDDVAGARAATGALLTEGHRRIAYLGNRSSMFTGGRRLEGFTLAHAAAGVTPDAELIRAGQQDVRSAERAMAELLEGPEPPTAVFTSNNRNTVGAIRAIVARRRAQDPNGSAVGPIDDVRMAAFDSFDLADIAPVRLSVVDHDAGDLGRRAAAMLVERLDGGAPADPRVVELPVVLRDLF